MIDPIKFIPPSETLLRGLFLRSISFLKHNTTIYPKSRITPYSLQNSKDCKLQINLSIHLKSSPKLLKDKNSTSPLRKQSLENSYKKIKALKMSSTNTQNCSKRLIS
jgi:hypothetical protein